VEVIERENTMDEQTLEDLYRQYVTDVYRYLLSLSKDHYISEDLVQEVFYRAYLHVDKDETTNIKAWLFRVAHNVWIDFLRKHKRVSVVDDEFFRTVQSNDQVEKQVLTKDAVQNVFNAMDELSPKYREAVLLSDVRELTYQEAADEMGVSLANYKSILFRARRKLRKLKEKDDDIG
jgi:RNA polymerase sigma-70 factor, ECF subfamily